MSSLLNQQYRKQSFFSFSVLLLLCFVCIVLSDSSSTENNNFIKNYSGSTSTSSNSISTGSRKRQTAADANCTIVIAGSASLTPTTSANPYATQSAQLIDGYKLFQVWSDAQEPVWVDGDLCNFTITWKDDQANLTLVRQIYSEYINNGTGDFFVGPASTDVSVAARSITEPNGKMLVGTIVSTSTFYLNYPHTFELMTSELGRLQAPMQLYALKGARKVAFVQETGAAFKAVCTTVEDTALGSGMYLMEGGGFTVFSSAEVAKDGYWENMTATVELLAPLDTDLLIVCGNPALANNLLTALEAHNYMPRAFYIANLDLLLFESFSTELLRYVSGAAQWTALANKPGDPNIFGSPSDYNQTFFDMFGYEANRNSAVGTIAPVLIQLAVSRAGTRDQEEVMKALSTLNMDTFWGRIAFDAQGGFPLRDADSIQYGFNRELTMVAPSRYATAEVIYPAPNWDDRYYNPQYFDYPSEIVIAVLSGVFILVSIALMIFTALFWKHIVITAASPLFLLLFLAGSIILDASVFMRMLHTNGVMCILTLWFWAIGFGLMFGALLAKTWRITKIINDTKGKDGTLLTKILLWLRIKSEKKRKKKQKKNKFNKVDVITWRKLLLILAFIVGIEVIILSIYTIIAPFFDLTEKVENSELYQSENYTRCELTPVAIVFMLLLAIYNVGLMVWGVILSWMLRNVQWTLFNESKAIAFAMYNMFFWGVLLVALEVSDAVERETMFILRSLGIFAATSISVWAIFGPKIYLIFRRVNSLDGSTSKDNKMSLQDEEEAKAEQDVIDRGLEDNPNDDPEMRRLKAMLRQVRVKIQDGTIPMRWEELERHAELEDKEEASSSSSSGSSDMENEEGVP